MWRVPRRAKGTLCGLAFVEQPVTLLKDLHGAIVSRHVASLCPAFMYLTLAN